MDFEAVVDELYGLPLKEFTAARKERAKAARAEGNPELSAVIHSLGQADRSGLVDEPARSRPPRRGRRALGVGC
ncbi:MAG: hypothetical protein WKF73_10890 [Nocardioidaceae bacterium]